jgi:uncharacterized damage-inducible protein DinB
MEAMAHLLHTHYGLIKESREVVFLFLQEQVKDEINTPLETFNCKTISYLYLHIANTYIAWAGNFAMGDSTDYNAQEEPASLAHIQVIFNQVDEMMVRFSEQFAKNSLTPVKGYKWPDRYIETNAFKIFTHVITHEFHHKGQAMTMARLLGHVPPDTDIMRF